MAAIKGNRRGLLEAKPASLEALNSPGRRAGRAHFCRRKSKIGLGDRGNAMGMQEQPGTSPWIKACAPLCLTQFLRAMSRGVESNANAKRFDAFDDDCRILSMTKRSSGLPR